MNQTETLSTLKRYIQARYPIVILQTHEEERASAGIRAIAKLLRRQIATWSITKGLSCEVYSPDRNAWNKNDAEPFSNPAMTRDPLAALESAGNYHAPERDTIFVFRDLHGPLGNRDRGFDFQVVRALRDIASAFEADAMNSHTLILVSPSFQVPPDLEKVVAMLDLPLPDSSDLGAILSKAELELPEQIPTNLNGSRENVIQAMRGLTAFEARQVLAAGALANRELSASIVPYIVREKAQIIKKSADGALEYYDTVVTMSDVGGLQNLKVYAQRKRRILLASKAREAGVDSPRGVLLVGVPGTGKSLAAKAIAGGQMPLLRLDVGKLFGGIVGQSEANTRHAIKLLEAVAPCVAWLDEIEKALGGGGDLDGGTSQRVFGTLLTWMQETTAPVYIVATANDFQKLKPELVRRFDNVFRVDLPNRESRIEILTVHLVRRGRSLTGLDIDRIAESVWGFSGAEIEKTVKDAIEVAFVENTALTTDHLLDAARHIVPIAETMKDKIEYMRRQSSTALPAGDPLEDRAAPQSEPGRVLHYDDDPKIEF